MKTNRKTMRLFTYLLISICVIPSVLYGQKTLGSTIIPQKTALLEQKSQATTNDYVTSEIRGLGLYRVLPVDRKTPEPFIPNDAYFQANKNKVINGHADQIVYNLYAPINNANNDEPKTDKIFCLSIYVVDGNQLQLTDESKSTRSA